jgi:hypothetical protein
MTVVTDLGTFSTGDVLTAADLTLIRNNFEGLAEPPHCDVYDTVGTSCSDGTATPLDCSLERTDSDGLHTGGSPSRITATEDGDYDIDVTASCPSGGGSRRLLAVRVNGSTSYSLQQVAPTGGGFSTILSGSLPLSLTAGDYVQLMFFQDSGGSLDVIPLRFCARWVSR